MIDLSVEVGGLRLSNPVMPASGTFGCGPPKSKSVSSLFSRKP